MTVMMVVGMSPGISSANMATDDVQFGGRLEGDGATLNARFDAERGGAGTGIRASRSTPEVVFQYTSVPACTGNDPNTENADVFCAQASTGCPPGELMYWLHEAPVTAPAGSGWSRVGQRCQGSRDPAEPRPVFPGFSLADFQHLPLPAGRANVEPGNGYTLITMPTNVYAQAHPLTLDTTLVGFPVQVRATPSRYAWDFGDGTGHGPTSEPGAPYPALTITHAYTAAGTYPITLTTYYRGEYSVAGGPWLPIPGEAQVASAPITVQALAGRNHLVAGDIDP